MRHCKNCGAKLANDITYCPLCDMETTVESENFDEDYPYIKPRPSARSVIKALTFSVIVVVAICFMIDHLLPFSGSWPLIVTASLVYVWLTLNVVIRRPRDPGAVVFSQLLLLSVFTAMLDRLCGSLGWSFDYVIPGLVMGAAIAVILCISIRPDKFRTYTLYQLLIALLGVIPIIFWALGISQIEWMALAASAVSMLCFAVIVVFSNRRTGSELRKRFHV